MDALSQFWNRLTFSKLNVYGIETERLVRNCIMTGVFVYLRIWHCFNIYSNTEAYLVFNGNAIRTLPCVHTLSTRVDFVWSAWWWKQGQCAIYIYMNVYSYSSINSDQYFLCYHCSMNSLLRQCKTQAKYKWGNRIQFAFFCFYFNMLTFPNVCKSLQIL